MKKTKIILLCAALMLAMAAALVGCSQSSSDGSQESSETKTIKIGASSNSEAMVQSGIAPLEEMGYTVEVITFDDFQTPNRALDEGEIDANLYQHLPFMNDFNNSNGTDLVMLEPVLWNYFTGLYSTKYNSFDELPDGALIGIAPEASNISLNLQYMQDWGMLKLSDEPADGEMFTELDIIENPKNLKFVTVEDAQRYSTPDEFDAYIACSDGLWRMGFDVNEGLIEKKTDDRWALGIVMNSKDVDSQIAKDLMAAYTSEAAVKYVEDVMQGCYIPADAAKEIMGR